MITIETDKRRLLQAGDVVDYHGRRARVTGVDLEDNDVELGPMFVITFEDDGIEQLLRSSACRIVEKSPARSRRSSARGRSVRSRSAPRC